MDRFQEQDQTENKEQPEDDSCVEDKEQLEEESYIEDEEQFEEEPYVEDKEEAEEQPRTDYKEQNENGTISHDQYSSQWIESCTLIHARRTCVLFMVLMFLSMLLILNFRTSFISPFKHSHLCCAMNA